MKIGIVGAPGAGKSTVARRLATKLGKDWKVIDGYTEAFSEVGVYADYQTQMSIPCRRWMLEAEKVRQGFHTISCGTHWESMVYTAIRGTFIYPDETLRMADSMLCQSVMTFLGGMDALMFDYDAVFFLELEGEPGHDWPKVINAKLPEAVESLGKIMVKLEGKTTKKVNDAYRIITTIRDSTVPDA